MAHLHEAWNSRLGVILAVSGSAVGLGNFLRFPSLAAKYGGGSFMVAYFVSLLVIGIPVAWAEWSMGRCGGRLGFHSSPGIFHVLLRRPWAKYLGVVGLVVPLVVGMYYVCVESWCLGYAYKALSGELGSTVDYGRFFDEFTGVGANGSALGFGLGRAGFFLVLVLAINLFLLYRGISRGIEIVCRIGMPTLLLIALVILVRVLFLGTPDASKPEQNLLAGLGFMWNPQNLLSRLSDPQLWLAAAGQVFFSLSVGMGIIFTYASYLRKTDDVVLSSVTAVSANSFCEVALGGMITVPAAFVFLGASGVAGGTFALGFKVLPSVFAAMPAGGLLASSFFVLLFLAALTSSVSILQPVVAFLEEAFHLRRDFSITWLAVLVVSGSAWVSYFSKDLKAMDTMDFWVGNVGVFVLGTTVVVLWGWLVGLNKSWQELHLGASFRVPIFFRGMMRYVTPFYLLFIFVLFLFEKLLGWDFSLANPVFKPTGYVTDLFGGETSPVAQLTVGFIFLVFLAAVGLTCMAGKRWRNKALAPYLRHSGLSVRAPAPTTRGKSS
ncbi:MAG: sodium-dependent transporter [Puniceicoccales bacterium]|nr:sodium-dependent transporter [Puniceicoccales bacterium]